MMRSLYSGVSGLKTHQIKMDVIGNNIANVNTVAFKSSTTTFSEIMYQTTSMASGASAQTGRGGVNAKQIGLGVMTGSTTVNISSPGATQTTGDGFDLKITGDTFFVVNNGSQNLFTKAGAFYIDGSGNLAMKSTGYNVMGWQVDETTGTIKKDTVSALRIMQEKNLTSPPESTTKATCSGILDINNTQVNSDEGYIMSLNFYDALGYSYTAKFAVKADTNDGEYRVSLTDVLDSTNTSLFANSTLTPNDVFGNTRNVTYSQGVNSGYQVVQSGGSYLIQDSSGNTLETVNDPMTDLTEEQRQRYFGIPTGIAGATGQFNTVGGQIVLEVSGQMTYSDLRFDTTTGLFTSIDGGDFTSLNMSLFGGQFSNIEVDFTTTKSFNNGGNCTMGLEKGATDAVTGTGKKLGQLIGLSVDNQGMIWGSYDNGNTTVLGQVAVASFPNASGLEKVGENCYQTTLNSGEFDGIGQSVDADGGSISSGVLEMSNVDLSSEFTEMITTQRGFQANSRIITTSDSLLEELINLKR